MSGNSHDLVREAADAMRPIIERTVRELGLDQRQAGQLLPRISEAYITGRTDGANVFAEQVNRALATRGIHVAVAAQHATVRLLDED